LKRCKMVYNIIRSRIQQAESPVYGVTGRTDSISTALSSLM
jgi:hypothetical protein